MKMIRDLSSIVVAFLCATSLAFSQGLNVLVIGSTHSFSEGGESGVVHEKPFNPTAIVTHLQGILSQDPAITETVNVQFEDIYKTKLQTVIYSGGNPQDFTSHCYSLAQHYMWPDGKAARLTKLRGEGANPVWDYIVLCNDPYITANFPGLVAEGVKLIKQEVAKSANPAQVVVLAQWPESSSSFTATQFNEIAYRVGNSAGLAVVPAGKAWDGYGSKDTSSNHPTPRGEYLAAASIYSKLFNRSAKTSAYDYPTVGDAIADHALSVVQTNAGVAQYSGTYTSFNPFQMKYLAKRVVSYRETGTSTEDRIAQALDRLDDVQRISLTTTGYAGVPGTRWDFNYGRGNDWWEPEKQYDVNSATYDWVYGFPMHHYDTASAPTTMPYGIDKHYSINYSQYEDGTDLGIAYNMIRPGTREPDEPAWVRAIPIRLMWQKMCEVSPGFNPLGDSTHMHPNLNDATAAFMYTLLSGRCPVEPEPAVPTTSTTWMQWLGHKIGYETAWQMSHLTTRAPGFRVLPSATAAKTVTPTTKETMTVDFLNPPQSDVTVNISISNANAAIVGSNQLVFTPQNYKIPQNVVVAGIPGSAASESFNVVFTTVSTDEIYNGLSDSWDYTVNRSSPVTLTRVSKPTIQATANQNLPVTINLNTAGATSSNTILAGPSRGTAVWSGSNIIYTPASDFTGKDGFTFATNDAGTLSVGYVEITVSASVPDGMVSYRGNGNAGGAVPIDSNTYAQNATVTVLGNAGNLTRVGYNFSGWNTAADGSGTNYNASSTFTIGTSGVILYAKWISVPTYTVSYNANASNSGVAPSNQIKTEGVDLTLATNIGTLAKNGYTFAGWNTLANGTGTQYAAGGTYSGNANVTLYARWTPNNYTVTFNANGGGTPSPTTKLVTHASTYGTLAAVSYPGFTFNGWFTAVTGGTQILATTTVTITGNQTLYAQWTAGASYTVSYDANGATSGTVPANQNKLENVTLTLATNSGGLTRTNYTFAGWNTAPDGSGTSYATGASYTDNAAVVLYAQWALNTYAVSYDGNGSTGGTAPSNQTKTHGINLTLSGAGTLVRSGYTFVSWNTAANGSGTTYAAGAVYSNDAAVTLYAQWTALPTYTVTYNGNGSTGGVAPSDQTKIQGSNLTLSGAGTLVRTGYAFANWNTAANGSGTAYAAGAIYSTDAAVTLYAQWTALPTYVVTYDGNGSTGGVAPSDQIKTQGMNLTLSGAGTLVRTGYTFANWNTAANGSGTTYSAGATYPTDAAVTLYAQWTVSTYAVTYDSNSASSGTAPANQTKTHDVSLTLQTNTGTLARTGYSFNGWNTAANGSGTAYAIGAPYTANAAVTLYAAWTANSYTVTFDANGGDAPSPANKSVTYASTYGALATTNRTGYTFNGWFTATSGGIQVNSGTTITTAANHTLYAQWTADSYTITFDANGGDAPNPTSKSVTYGSTYGTLATVSRAGYTFSGWFTAASGGTQITSGTTVAVTSAQTLYAQWIVGVLLTWDANGTGAGQTNGGGAWETANLWWNGTSNANWQSGASASFGGPNTAGGAVTLAAPTTVENFTFNPFTGAYTLGTAAQNLTINSGINMNASAGAVTIVGPVILGGPQIWTNNSTGLLKTAETNISPNVNFVTNGGHQLTINGTGITQIGRSNETTHTSISGSGALVKNGTGFLQLGGNNSAVFSGKVTINGGVVNYGDSPLSLGTGNIEITNGVLESRWTTGITRNQGTGINEIQITGGISGFSGGNNPTFNLGAVTWGSATFNPTQFVLNSSVTGATSSSTFSSAINLGGTTRTIRSDQAGGDLANGRGIFSGAISNGGIIKDGIGQIVFTGTNTYAGGTTINAGTLRFDTVASMPTSGAIAINGGANLGIALGSAGQWTTGISGAGTLGGLLSGVGGAGSSTLAYSGDVGLVLNVTANATYSGVISNPAGATNLRLTKIGNSTLTLTGNNSHSGGTTLSAGALAVGSVNALGSGTLALNGGTILSSDATARSLANAVTIGGNFTVGGTGNLTFSNTGVSALGSTTRDIFVASGITAEFAQTFTGTAGLNKGNVTGGILRLSGTSSYTGVTNIKDNAGAYTVLEVTVLANGGQNSSIGASSNAASNLVLNNASALRYVGSTDTVTDRAFHINSGTAGHGVNIESSGSGTLTFSSSGPAPTGTANRYVTFGGTNTGSNTFAKVITGATTINKSGTGKWVFTADNSYTGTTAINAGKLFINGNQSSATGNLTVSANATLGGTGMIGGSTTIADGGKLEFDISTPAGSHNPLNVVAGKDFTFVGSSTLTITHSSGAEPGTYTLVTGGNNIVGLAPGTLNLPAGWSATVSISGNSLLLNVASTGVDTIAPTVVSITDNSGGSILANSTVNYTVTFSEEMDAATVQPADFGNAGTAAGVINSATETSPGVFLVSVTPTSAGSLQLRINAGATLADLAGLPVNTTSAILDDTTITVTPLNTAPVANSQSVGTDEDTALPITLIGNDAQSDPLTYTVLTTPANGTLSGTAPNLTYTPAANYNGADSFTFRVNDGALNSNTATVSITVTAVNDAPAAVAQNVATAEDTTLPITLAGTDVENSTLTYAIVTPPANGTLSGTPPNLIYTPNANSNGADGFTFTVNDGSLGSVASSVAITVNPVNDAPVAVAQNVTTTEDAAVAITLTGTDVENSALTYTIVTPPANGTLSGTAPNLTYTPAANSNAADSFTFKTNDGTVDSAPATISITITPVNDAPVAVAQNVSTAEDTALPVTLTGTDVENSTLTYTVVTSPANGTLSGTAPNLTYTPSANYNGSDSLTFKVHDGTVDSATATVSITVNPVNDAPVAVAQNVSTAEDTAIPITLTGTDAENSTLTYTVVASPANGTLSGTAPNVTFTPTANYTGADSFTFKVNDGTVDSTTATVSITITAVNDAPVFTSTPIITADASETVAYTGQTLAGRATDPDAGDTITYSKVSGPAWLNVASNGTLSGTPTAGTAGLNTYTVRATDSTSATADATLQITVVGLPLPWIASDIGTGMLAGSTTHSSGTFTQAGSGIIAGTADKLRFTYQTLTGDGEIIARISSLQNTGTSSRVGVMIRDTLATNSKQIFMGLTSSGSYRWARRTATGGSTSSTNSSSGTVPNTWVRLVRSGTTITAYKSTNGTSWTTVGSTTATTFNSTCYIGLAVGSGSDTTLNTSQFSNISVTP